MLSAPRPLSASEHEAALHLWQGVFGTPPGYFERYYDGADPGYQVGDTLGIWDGAVLASAVHLCRRPVAWAGGDLLCGGIANVATLPDYRRQGLSRLLLAQLIQRMEQAKCHFSLLGTGTPSHYSALGWELTQRPHVSIRLFPREAAEGAWDDASRTAPLKSSYDAAPRPLQFLRPEIYFENWVGWEWRRKAAQVYVLPGRGYAVLAASENADQPASVLEWRAVDADTEMALLTAAAAQAQRRGCHILELDTLPHDLEVEKLAPLGEVNRHIEGSGMIRRLALPMDGYLQIQESYRSGQAAWWSGDGF